MGSQTSRMYPPVKDNTEAALNPLHLTIESSFKVTVAAIQTSKETKILLNEALTVELSMAPVQKNEARCYWPWRYNRWTAGDKMVEVWDQDEIGSHDKRQLFLHKCSRHSVIFGTDHWQVQTWREKRYSNKSKLKLRADWLVLAQVGNWLAQQSDLVDWSWPKPAKWTQSTCIDQCWYSMIGFSLGLDSKWLGRHYCWSSDQVCSRCQYSTDCVYSYPHMLTSRHLATVSI